MQHKMTRYSSNIHSCLKSAIFNKINFVLMQESFMFDDNVITTLHNAYYCVLSSCSSSLKSGVVIYAKKKFI